jgi:hypothetical protein
VPFLQAQDPEFKPRIEKKKSEANMAKCLLLLNLIVDYMKKNIYIYIICYNFRALEGNLLLSFVNEIFISSISYFMSVV